MSSTRPLKGTKIANVAQPIAQGIDYVFGTNVQGCSGCHEMETDLNEGETFLNALMKRMKGQYGRRNTDTTSTKTPT